MNVDDLARWRVEHPELHARSIELAKRAPALTERQRALIAAMVKDVRRKLIKEGGDIMSSELTFGYTAPFLPGQPHVLAVDEMTDHLALARLTVELLDEDAETIVHWHVPCGQDFRREPAFTIARRAGELIMQRRPDATTFTVVVPFDGIFRFANTPTLFDATEFAS